MTKHTWSCVSSTVSTWVSGMDYVKERAPLLLASVSIAIGAGAVIYTPIALIILSIPKKIAWYLAIFGYGYCRLTCPPLPDEIIGDIDVKIESIRKIEGPLYKSMAYKVKIKKITSPSGIFYNIPAMLYNEVNCKTISPSFEYKVPNAKLTKISHRDYRLKPPKYEKWTTSKNARSLVGVRVFIKGQVRSFIKKRFGNTATAKMLTALMAGSVDDRLLMYQFNRVGIGHLFAISGLHFATLAMGLNLLIRKVFSKGICCIILMFLLTGYYLYMGNSPSVERAWIGSMVHLFGSSLGYMSTPLNSLGAALLVAVIRDPMSITSPSLQLSFISTAGLLIFYTDVENLLRKILPKRKLSRDREMAKIDQVVCLICGYVRKTAAVQMSILILTLPLVLVIYGKYPIISFIYNAIYPPLMASLLLLSILPFSKPAIVCGEFMLNIIYKLPRRFALNMGWYGWFITIAVVAGLFLKKPTIESTGKTNLKHKTLTR